MEGREVLIKNVTCSFNILDPDQKRLYEHATKRANRSAFLKRLIQRDMEGGGRMLVAYQQKEPAQLDRSLMKGLV